MFGFIKLFYWWLLIEAEMNVSVKDSKIYINIMIHYYVIKDIIR
jgi:hypothetical protein